tara:strand:- start:35 stop:307 length:273 start_codon:yes stop_codon:yes gene_type:complete
MNEIDPNAEEMISKGIKVNSQFSQNNKDNEKIEDSKWINNYGEEVQEVFGFNQNAELVNGRAAMFGFLMLIITELTLRGEPVTKTIFGIG